MNSVKESLEISLTKIISFIPLLIIASACVMTTALLAQQVEEVVVEAEVSDSDPLNDLVSASVLDGEKLADAGIENVEDVAAYVPNLTLTQTETGTQTCIRGICQGLNQGIDPSVGLYVDKVPYPRPNMSRAPFLDLAGVQVLRGPQYGIDGHYSIAGSIHVLTNLSLDEFKAGFDFSYVPSQNDSKMLLTLGGPINDAWAANFVIQRQTSDGYVENVARAEDGPAKDQLLARWVLGYRPTDALSFKLKIEQGRFDSAGRQTEIIYAEQTPFPTGYEQERYFQFYNRIPGGSRRFLEARQITEQFYNDNAPLHYDPVSNDTGTFIALRREASETALVASAFEAPEDFLFRPLKIAYDVAGCEYVRVSDTVTGGAGCEVPDSGPEFYFAGLSYQEKLEELYIENGYEVPLGLLDSELDFRRAADTPEKSENDSFNVTLNTELKLGEGLLSLTASYIDYDQVDLIDGDELPVTMLFFDQEENYSQEFFQLDYDSGSEGFLTFKTGVSYQSSKLEFEDQLNFGLVNVGNIDNNVNQLDLFTPANYDPDEPLTFPARFDPEMPLRAYLGGTPGGNAAVAQLQRWSVNRQFDQDADIGAAFFQGTVHWRDNLRTTLGLRYTISEKSAVRDSVIVDPTTGEVPLEFIRENAAEFGSVSLPLLQFFNLQIHTDRFQALADDRPDDVDELTLAPAFGDPNVPGGTSDCLDLVLQKESDGTLSEDENGDFIVIPQRNGTGSEALCFDPSFRSARAIRGTRREETLLPSISVEWDATQDLSLIGSVRAGNKLGGYDARSTTRPDLPATGVGTPGTFEFEDETAVSYELLARWFLPVEYGGLLNASLYLTEYTNLQFTRLNGAAGQNVENAGRASSLGVEVDGYINLSEQFSINYSMAWTDFEFKKYDEGPCYLGERPDYFLVVSQNEQLRGIDRDFGLENRDRIEINYGERPRYVYDSPLYRDGEENRIPSEGRIFRLLLARGVSGLDSEGGELIRFQNALQEQDFTDLTGLEFGVASTFYGQNSYDDNPFNQPAFCDRAGSRAQYVAEWQGTVSVNYKQNFGQGVLLKPTLDIIYNSGYFTTSTLDPDLAQDEFVQFNGRLEIADVDERWVFALTGENLTDEKIVSYSREIFGSRTQGAKVASGVVRSPRAFGVNVRYTFY